MKVIKENTKNEIIIKNSKFITLLIKILKEDEVKEVLKDIKKQYPKATHYCYAYKILDNIKKQSDDGEPSKTAGFPMLNVLDKEDVTNILAVTIRYFGGIKLGAGGLVRAYTRSVKEALENVEKINLIKGYLCKITFPYNKENEILRKISKENIIEKTYLKDITYTILLEKDSPLLPNAEIIKETYIEKSISN